MRRRLKDVRKELSAVRGEIRLLKKDPGSRDSGGAKASRDKPGTGADARIAGGAGLRRPEDRAREASEEKVVKERARRLVKDERFVGYLARSVDSLRPLRHERRIQRNRAIMMTVLAVIVLLWVVYRYLV